ncbi:MAG: hypothetical protein QOI96_1793 [Verrucomicrobiota bacterium]
MKKLVHWWTPVLGALFMTACSSPTSGPTTGREHYALSKAEETRLEFRAAKGDRRAAVRLFEYHALVTGDKKEIKRWRARVNELTPGFSR